MGSRTIALDRQKLNDEVWTKTATEVASSYGVSEATNLVRLGDLLPNHCAVKMFQDVGRDPKRLSDGILALVEVGGRHLQAISA